jgi:hypothetical protein
MSLRLGRLLWIIDLSDGIWIFLEEWGMPSFDWIGLAHNKDKWRALVNAVMDLRVP